MDVEFTNSKKNLEKQNTEPMLAGFGYWRSAVTPDINCEADVKNPKKENKDFVTFTMENL